MKKAEEQDGSMELDESTPILSVEYVAPNAVHYNGGLSVTGAVCFLIGELIGVGALALPNALSRSGWAGILTLFWACVIAIYNGKLLADCWTMLLDRYPEYRKHVRYPYGAIGEEAIGKWMRYVISFCLVFTCLGTCTLYLIITAENLHSIFSRAGLDVNFCLWMIIIVVLLIPLAWFGSPKSFCWIAVVAAIGALTGCGLVFIKLLMSLPPAPGTRHQFPSTFKPYFLSFGTILFAFSGASTFPTIQHDMREPHKFKTAVVIAYTIGMCVYLPLSVAGFYVYGQHVGVNILYSLPNGGFRIAAEIFYIVHLLFAYIIYINPVLQSLEESCNIPLTQSMKNWKRLLFRTAVILFVLFIAETVPHFGALVSLIGGSSSAYLTFIAPPVLYTCLRTKVKKERRDLRKLSVFSWIVNIVVIAIGIITAIASTYGSILQLVLPNTFVPPCYVNATAAQAVYSYARNIQYNFSTDVNCSFHNVYNST